MAENVDYISGDSQLNWDLDLGLLDSRPYVGFFPFPQSLYLSQSYFKLKQNSASFQPCPCRLGQWLSHLPWGMLWPPHWSLYLSQMTHLFSTSDLSPITVLFAEVSKAQFLMPVAELVKFFPSLKPLKFIFS